MSNGAIDIAYYERRARALRARCMRLWLRKCLARIARFWRRRAAQAELYRLDERAMRDIGITGGDIPAIVSGIYFRDNSRRQRGARMCDALDAPQRTTGELAMTPKLATLDYLRHFLSGTLPEGATSEMKYPTAISKLLGFRVVGIDRAYARLEMNADADSHGNQQGTVHGGLLSELADAAIGTAHSTAIGAGETFTSIDLRISFFRPVWKSVLTATAKPTQLGRTIAHYQCEIVREDGKLVALAAGTVMTLRGTASTGR